jgi:hypothetical protein
MTITLDAHFFIALIISSLSAALGLIHGLALNLKTEDKLFTHYAA